MRRIAGSGGGPWPCRSSASSRGRAACTRRLGDRNQLWRAIGEAAAGCSMLDPRIVQTLPRHHARPQGSHSHEGQLN
jgi:hypothetical protein